MEPGKATLKGMLGTAGSAAGISTSLSSAVETWLRIGSLLAGLIVAVLTAISLWRSLQYNRAKTASVKRLQELGQEISKPENDFSKN